jgi:hypothetical protein
MDLTIREIFGLAAGVLVLAGLTKVVTQGGNVATILTAAGNSFSGVIKAATGG